jgi:hypothetical protein
METAANPSHESIRTNIPQRLDRLPWSRGHWLVVTARGVTWMLDGLKERSGQACRNTFWAIDLLQYGPVVSGWNCPVL